MITWGFEYGPGGNKNGSGDFITRLNAAGIPVCMKGTDDAGLCYEAQNNGHPDSTLIYRVSTKGQNDGNDYDVPFYHLPPDEAEELHFNMTVAKWPPELLPSRVWMEPINEPRAKPDPDKPNYNNMHPCDWLGEFMTGYAIRANAAGFKVCGPGFNAGEPGDDGGGMIDAVNQYSHPGMLRWLAYCAENPTKAALSIHEYTQDLLSYANSFPHKLGRFQAAIAAADNAGIARTFPIFITEWGWTLNTVPTWENAVATIQAYSQLSAQFPQLRAAAIWSLRDGFKNISNLLSAYISDNGNPFANWVIDNQYPDETQPQATAAEFGATLPGTPPIIPPGGTMLVTVEIEDKDTPYIAFRGWLGRDIERIRHRWIYRTGEIEGDQFTEWTDELIVIPALDDIRGLEFLANTSRMLTKEIEVDCAENPNPPDPPGEIEIVDIVDDLPKHATLTYATRPLSGITTLTIHHTVSPPDRSISSIAAYHVDSNGWPGIGYGYVIKDTGAIFQTNHLETKSYHAGSSAAPGDENEISVGISLQGDFTNAAPPQAQQDAARALVSYLSGFLPNVTAVLGHRQMPGAATQCPGNTFEAWLPYIVDGSQKFKPGDRVKVVSDTLNVRSEAYGDLLGSQPVGALGTISEGGVLNGGFVWWNVDYDNAPDGWSAQNWLELESEPKPPDPPPPPTGKTVDFTNYLLPSTGGIGQFVVFEKVAGGTIDHQMQVQNGIAYVVKRAAIGTEYEELRISNGFIQRRYDTSPADGFPYKLDDGDGWSNWIPVVMTELESYQRKPHVTRYKPGNCEIESDEGVSESWITFAKYHESYTLPGGLVKTAVCELHWTWAPGGTILERYFVAPDRWYVQWGNGDALHYLNEEPLNREPLPLNPIPCLT